MNSETDFVAKNEEFQDLVKETLKTIIKSNAKTLEEALNLPYENGTINDLIVSKTAKIGEKTIIKKIC